MDVDTCLYVIRLCAVSMNYILVCIYIFFFFLIRIITELVVKIGSLCFCLSRAVQIRLRDMSQHIHICLGTAAARAEGARHEDLHQPH